MTDKTVKLTMRRLRAMEQCLNAPLAGDIGEGDYQDLNELDTICALAWVQQEITKRLDTSHDG